jgi:hypothetical protein
VIAAVAVVPAIWTCGSAVNGWRGLREAIGRLDPPGKRFVMER